MPTRRARMSLLSLALATALAGAVRAQAPALTVGEPVELGESISLRSEILSEMREARVYLPPRYAAGTDAYPVLYVLDGRNNFLHVVATARFLALGVSTPLMPEFIVAAVHNTQRERDMRVADLEGDCAAQRFHEFFAEELIPAVDDHYRTQPFRIVMGHSQGGLFSTYVLATRPETFRWYLTIAPPLFQNPGSTGLARHLSTQRVDQGPWRWPRRRSSQLEKHGRCAGSR